MAGPSHRALSRQKPLAQQHGGATRAALTGAASSLGLSGTDGQERLDLRRCRHFVNLTNGIEAVPMLDVLGLPYSFVRIQSTACEQQNLEALMCELDANLLLSLALGHCCIVYDLGSRGRDGTPRALWYGLEFVRYTLSKLWLRRPCAAVLRGKNVARTFDEHIAAFKQSTRKRLQYYVKYIPQAADGSGGPGLERLRLYGAYRPTVHDYDTAFYVDLLHRHELRAEGKALPAMPVDAVQSHPCGQQRNGLPNDCITALASTEPAGRRQDLVDLDCKALVPLPVVPARHGSEPAKGAGACGGCGNVLGNGADHQTQESAAVAGGEGSGRTEGRGGLAGEKSGGLGGRGRVDAEDGEAVLARYGFRVFWRGLTPQEWAAASQQDQAA